MKYRDSLAGLVLVICLTVSGCKFLLSSSISDRSGSGQTGWSYPRQSGHVWRVELVPV